MYLRPVIYSLLGSALLIISLIACQQSNVANNKAGKNILTIQQTHDYTQLYFNGTVEPLSLINVSSPTNGTIAAMHFTFGQKVHKHQLLLQIKSAELSKQYQESLAAYLKSKEAYITSKQKFSGTQRLKKDGIISEIEFRNNQVQFNDSYLSYVQAKKKLQKLLKELNINADQIFNLDITKRQSLVDSLNKATDTINIYASADGLALHPLATNNNDNGNGDNKSANIVVGSPVKKDSTLLSIGDINGLKINVNVDEINILSIEQSQPVTITGVAFPGIVLHGYVASVSDQANTAMGNSIPTFPISIIVPKLTKSQQQHIHIGMSAKATINIDHGSNIIVPINAVFQRNGKTMVTLLNKKTGKPHNIVVHTGHTTATKIVITKGVKAGDQLVIHH